jgi:hypothetical protein
MVAFGITELGIVALAGSRATDVLAGGVAIVADAWMGIETAISRPTQILKSCARKGLLLI